MILLSVITLGLAAAVVFLIFKRPSGTSQDASMMLKSDITELSKNVDKLKDSLQQQLSQQLGASNKQMAQQFASSAKIIKDVTEHLTKLDETNKQVVSVADELQSLQNVLQNPKQRGVLGEFYLEQILQNLLPPNAYELQYKLTDGLVVDAVIKMDDRLLPIDSKFSLENYNRLVEEKDKAKKAVLERQFKEDLKKRIDETSKYILPKKGTLEQALMFIPSEAIFYDLLANKVGAGGVNGRDLVQYAAVDKKVAIVGPSTFSAMLQSILQGLRSMEIQKDTELIRNNVEQLRKHLINHEGYFKRVGNSLGATVGHYNNAYKELGKVDKDIVKIAGSEPVIDTISLEKPLQED